MGNADTAIDRLVRMVERRMSHVASRRAVVTGATGGLATLRELGAGSGGTERVAKANGLSLAPDDEVIVVPVNGKPFVVAKVAARPSMQGGALGIYFADDYATPQAAGDAAAANGGGQLWFTEGQYVGPFTWKTGVTLRGMGRDVTKLTIPNGTNAPVVKSDNFDSLVGGNTSGGIRSCGLFDLTVDGNAAGQSGVGSGAGTINGVSVYGYDFDVGRCAIVNCLHTCWRSKWGTSLDPPQPNGMEARVSDLIVHDADQLYTFFWGGPHDSQISNVIGYGGVGGFIWAENGGACQVSRTHSYGSSQNYAYYLDASSLVLDNIIAEGASAAQIFLAADGILLHGFKAYKAGGSATGIEIVESSKAYDLIGTTIDCAPAVKYTSDGGEGRIDILAYSASSGSVESGTPSATTARRILAKGALTGTVDVNGTE